ncbi:MAG: hypothetical protein ISR65_18185 [Bacteriovoracaceae bacterium]|nr:hypothetical protein [Bacteriovoracaceae bacterium]
MKKIIIVPIILLNSLIAFGANSADTYQSPKLKLNVTSKQKPINIKNDELKSALTYMVHENNRSNKLPLWYWSQLK